MRYAWIHVAVVGTFIGIVGGSASAQHFHNSHHHHDAAGHRVDDAGHHIDNHGHHTGWQGVYDHDVTPSYYVQPSFTPSYVTPHVTNYPQFNSVAPGNVLPSPATAAFTGGPIQIVSPAGVGGTVNYALNNYKYSIQPGQTQTIQADRDWIITFGRGESFGSAKYALTPGVYQFAVTAKGWELQKQPAATAQAQQDAPPAPPAPSNPIPAIATPGAPSGVTTATATTPTPTLAQ